MAAEWEWAEDVARAEDAKVLGGTVLQTAKIVEKEGKIYAIEKNSHVLDQLIQIAKSEGLDNIIPIYFCSKYLKELLHDDSYNKGDILSFRKM